MLRDLNRKLPQRASPHDKDSMPVDVFDAPSAPRTSHEFVALRATELKQLLLMNEKIQLIDVRESYERDICHIGGEHIPLSLLEAHMDQLDRLMPVVAYCKSGGRSATACQKLFDAGFKHISHLGGGILEWIDAVDNQLMRY